MIGELAGIGAALAWAGGGLFIKPVSDRFNPLLINTLRIGLAWPILILIVIPWRGVAGLGSLDWHSTAYLIGSGIIGLVIGTTAYIRALSLADLSRIYPICYGSWIFFTALIAATFLGESISYLTAMGATLVLLSIFLLGGSSLRAGRKRTKAELRGIFIALFAGLCWGIAVTLLKLGLRSVDPITANAVRLPFAAIALALLTSWQGGAEYGRLSLRTLAMIEIAGILDQVIGSVLYFLSIKLAGATEATILACTSPLFALPLSIIFLREKLTWRKGLGALICVLGMYLLVFRP